MGLTLSITSGFITNSSSVIYNFPNEMLEFPEVKALFRFYNISMTDGLIPADVWHRSVEGDTVVFNREQKQILVDQTKDMFGDFEDMQDMRIPTFNPEDDSTFTLIASDEAGTIVLAMIHKLDAIARKRGIGVTSDSFN